MNVIWPNRHIAKSLLFSVHRSSSLFSWMSFSWIVVQPNVIFPKLYGAECHFTKHYMAGTYEYLPYYSKDHKSCVSITITITRTFENSSAYKNMINKQIVEISAFFKEGGTCICEAGGKGGKLMLIHGLQLRLPTPNNRIFYRKKSIRFSQLLCECI